MIGQYDEVSYQGVIPNPNWFPKEPEIVNSSYLKSIVKVFNRLWSLGVLHRSAGQCLALTDITLKLLKGEGVECEIFECCLLVQNKVTGNFTFVGYEYDSIYDINGEKTEDIPTTILKDHVVLITKTEVPILIDLTCTFIDDHQPFIIRPYVTDEKDNVIINLDTSEWIYTRKQHSHVPILMQNNIIDRIKKDTQIDSELKTICLKLNRLNYIIIMLCVVAVTNFLRGGADFYQKYINKTNGWGPDPTYIHQPTKP